MYGGRKTGCGQCRGGFHGRDCGHVPATGVDPTGRSCKACPTRPKNCYGPPYGHPNVNYYPCGFGGNSYSCRGTEPWDIRTLRHVWNYRPCDGAGKRGCACNGQRQNNASFGPCNDDPPGCPPPHPNFARLQNQSGLNGNCDGNRNMYMEADAKNGREYQRGGNVDPCLADVNAADPCCEDPCREQMAIGDDPCETESQEGEGEGDDNCEDEEVTQNEVSKCMDRIQTYIMTKLREEGDDLHTINCVKDLVQLRINVLGTASSLGQ